MKKTKKKTVPSKVRIELSPGEMVRIARHFQGMTLSELAKESGIRYQVLQRIEHGLNQVTIERAEKLAKALKIHPSVIVWPNWTGVS